LRAHAAFQNGSGNGTDGEEHSESEERTAGAGGH